MSFYQNFPGKLIEDWSIAQYIAKFGVFAEFSTSQPTAYKLPVYPFFLSFFIIFFESYAKELIVIVQHILYALIPIIIIRSAKNINLEKAGILGSYFFIFSPAYFFYSNTLEATNLFLFLFACWIYFYSNFLNITKQKSFKNLISLSILTAIISLTQVVAVPIMLLLMFLLFGVYLRQYKSLLFIFLLSGLLYSPWVIRNYKTFDSLILSKSPYWQNIYTSYAKDLNIIAPLQLVSNEKIDSLHVVRSKISDLEIEKIYEKEAKILLEGKNDVVILKSVQNTFLLWYVPARYFYDQSLRIVLGRKIPVIVLNILTVLAMIAHYKLRRRIFYFFAIVFIGFTVPYAIGHAGNIRFKLDFEWLQYLSVTIYIIDLIKKKFVSKHQEFQEF